MLRQKEPNRNVGVVDEIRSGHSCLNVPLRSPLGLESESPHTLVFQFLRSQWKIAWWCLDCCGCLSKLRPSTLALDRQKQSPQIIGRASLVDARHNIILVPSSSLRGIDQPNLAML